ncbi:uncharacterized protein BJ171DRAFT_494153 [Polychytrium aggregatum]|uniref:uncharacterized protein n=1 Tax=Polychytrium aggregatum TaxID=110093 RepID=UPI0022FDB456|nr:uncharacterized protein BJ171DRAFT_494153 [Polychytrium aggregatum]KAI9207283.1 hypothetical protein BJ171DRAFT_494153 [Polychytrium aggregatum]
MHQQIFHYLQNAARANHHMAQFHMASCFLNGLGVDQDLTKAAELYRSLAENGIPQAQVALGSYYESGEGVDQDYDAALRWYTKAADQGSEDGRLHFLFLRGWLSFLGHGIQQSDEAAFARWQEVSNQSTNRILKPIATHMVGWMHYLGRGTQLDQEKGIKTIRENKSDDFPFGEDQSLAGRFAEPWNYFDSPASLKFYRLCKLGSEHDWLCKHLMAVSKIQALGTTEDQIEAAVILEQLANDGHSDSQFWAGECYNYGRGVTQDKAKAFEWYNKSADQNNPYGRWRVGWCHYFGDGVATSFETAVDWWRPLAEQGNRYAQNALGDCYGYALGVPHDLNTAASWYRRSADQDLQWAIDNLERIGM